MPEASGDHATDPAPALDAVLQDLMGSHTAPPPARSHLLGYALPAALLLGAVAYAAAHLWLFAAMFVGLAVSMTWRTRGRLDGAFTEVTERGVTVHTRDAHRDLAWDDVEEVYPRASWAPFPTLRVTSGSTVPLPGVSDELAPRLEHARADRRRCRVDGTPRTTQAPEETDAA